LTRYQRNEPTELMRKEVQRTMKTLLILCLVLFVAVSFGCSKKKEEAPKTETSQVPSRETIAGKPVLLVDPVSKEEIEPATAQYYYEYNGAIYYFTSAANMEAFKANPEKYLAEVTSQQEQQRAAPSAEGH
jgi:YHS domain-containing protein